MAAASRQSRGVDHWPWRTDAGCPIGQRYLALRQTRRGYMRCRDHFQLVALVAQRAKLIGLQTSAFEQAIEEQGQVKRVGIAGRRWDLDTVLCNATERRAERCIALANRCRRGLSQGHVMLQQMGGQQQFDVAGGDRFGRLDHAQGLDQLCIRTDGEAQAEAWQAKFFEKLSM